MPAWYKFTVGQGATWAVTLTFKDLAGLLDLTGYSARLQIRESIDSPVPLLDLTSEPGGGLSIDGPAGRLSWEVADEITTTWTWRHAVIGLELESAAGRTLQPLQGEVVVNPEVVR